MASDLSSARNVGRINSGGSGVICLSLALMVCAVFGRTVGFEFINFDDPTYVTQNPFVSPGLTVKGVSWALTRTHSANWHSLTWICHMLDCQIYGLWAGGHHLTSVVLHAANAALLFLVLHRMTGQAWPSAFVAGVFAVHPLRVESVAWVSERKDVLSGLLFMATLLAYARFTSEQRFSGGRYLAVVILLCAGLMAKPMLVTLPCVLFLLDAWPLNRMKGLSGDSQRVFRKASFPILFVEKLPLLGIAVLASVLTVNAQADAMASVVDVTISERLSNAIGATVCYLHTFFIPVNLAIFYPLEDHQVSPVIVAAGAVTLLTISVIAWITRGDAPWLFVGWFWYLVMLLPVSGILQAGGQSRADRFTYLPQIGVAIIIVFGIHALLTSPGVGLIESKRRKQAAFIAAAGWLAVLAVAAYRQTGYWRNSETVWRHALEVTSRNGFAHLNLGLFLEDAGEKDAALAEYLRAVRISPAREFVEAAARCGRRLVLAGRRDEASDVYQALVDCGGTVEWMLMDLANLVLETGDTSKAAAYRDWALRACGGDKSKLELLRPVAGLMELPSPPRPVSPTRVLAPDVRRALAAGMRHVRAKRFDDAITAFRQAVSIDPECADAHNNIGMACSQLGRDTDAERAFHRAIEIDATRADYHVNLAMVLFTLERWEEAAAASERALVIDPLDVETAAFVMRIKSKIRQQ